MAQLEPFGDPPFLAVAVSGGADSLALALLADEWAKQRRGSILALIIDHGLRHESAGEAHATARLLVERRVESRIISLRLSAGVAMQERAREARHRALACAAREAGAVHLLFGHHWRDQTETVAMRAARSDRGLAGMAPLVARSDILMLRPLLHVDPARLRDFLRQKGCVWVEDPSNADHRFERVRIRALQEQRPVVDPAAIGEAGWSRREEMRGTARWFASCTEIHPEGYALWRRQVIPPEALAALLRAVGGRLYPPDRRSILRLADWLRPATLGGVQLVRWRGDWLLAREPASCAAPAAIERGMSWDGRFMISNIPERFSSGSCRVGALGRHAAEFRKNCGLPSLVMKTLPAVYDCDTIIAVPHLGYGTPCRIDFCPPGPVAPIPFVLHPFVYNASSSEGAGT